MISTIRHQTIFDSTQYKNLDITLIGAGAIGSRVFEALISLGLTKIAAVDDDIVEGHNLANQAFIYDDIGKPKVDGLKRLYERKTGSKAPPEMRFVNDRIPSLKCKPTGIVFLMVDTIAARRLISEMCLTPDNERAYHVIDTRMASSYGQILGFNPSISKKTADWQATLGTDEHTELSPCGSTISVGPTASIIANMAVWHMINYLTDSAAVDNNAYLTLKPLSLNAGAIQ